MKKLLFITIALLVAGLLYAINPLPQPPPTMLTASGLTSTNDGAFGYDTTNNMLHAAQGGSDAMVPQFTISPANNDPACWVVSGNNYKLGNTGCTAGSSVVKQAIVNISAAQVKTLNGSPVTIVAAQGAGTYIEFVSATVEFVSNGTQYTSGNTLVFKVNGQWVSSSYSSGNFDGLSATGLLTGWTGGGNVGSIGDQRNQALVIANDSGPEYASGNGTLIVHVQYVVHAGL